MNFVLLILNTKIRLGKTEIPVLVIIPVVLLFVFAAVVNLIYLRRYNAVLGYLREFHPEAYEQTRRKPDVGRLYSTAYNYSKPLVQLAKRSKDLNDPKAEKLLADFVRFDRTLNWLSSGVMVLGVLVVFVLGISLS
jgi:hypothetical protein